ADDPALTVRLPGYRGRQPLRIVLDSSGRVPATSRLFDESAPTLVATTARAPAEATEAWSGGGATVLRMPESAAASRPGQGEPEDLRAGPVRLRWLLAALAGDKTRIRSVLIEGGPAIAWSAIREGVVDRLVVYVAPKLVGDAAA